MEILYPDEGCLEAPALTVDASKSFLKTDSLDESLLEICWQLPRSIAMLVTFASSRIIPLF